MKCVLVPISAGNTTCGQCHLQNRVLWRVSCLAFKKSLKTEVLDRNKKGVKYGIPKTYRCKECIEGEEI